MKAIAIFVILVLLPILLAGCTGGALRPSSGWAGPVVAGELVYVGTRDGRVLSIDAQSGDQRASFPPKEQDPLAGIYGSPALAEGMLFVGGYDGKLYALDKGDLKLRWEFPADRTRVGRIVGAPSVAGGLVIFGSSDGIVRALSATDGRLAWSFPTENMVWSTPSVAGDTVYFGSMDHRVYAVGLRDGKTRWLTPFEADGAIVSSPVVRDGKVFVGSFDRSFYVLDASEGKLIRRFQEDAWFWSNPVTDGKRVYAASMSGKLYALDINEGLAWRELFDLEHPVLAAPALVEGRIVITSDGGIIYVLSPDTGRQEGTYDVGAEVRAPLEARNGVVYVSAMDNQVWALRMVGEQKRLWRTATDGKNKG